MNIYGSLMDIYDEKNKRHLCRKIHIHLCRKTQKHLQREHKQNGYMLL